jgi:tetratricopeptide (TPR) repeat protein
MKIRAVIFILMAAFVSALYAQPQAGRWGDAELARQYVGWARQMIDSGRWEEALAGLERANDYADVSSDISYLLASARLQNIYSDMRCNRLTALDALERAIETNRWETYNESMALFLKAEQLIIIRRFLNALSVLEQIEEKFYPPGAVSSGADFAADLAYLRLLAFRGMASGTGYDAVQSLARFRSLVLSAMDRYPRDPRPLRVFFEYARNRKPEHEPGGGVELPQSDINLLELALRRLPFLLETDPDLAWMAAPFMRDIDAARRLVSSYRAGGLSNGENFRPVAGSIAPALNLGLLGDIDAVEELFDVLADNENPVLYKKTIADVYNLLRSEEGRDLFTRKLLSFSGAIFSDDDGDGYIESRAFYKSGILSEYRYEKNQSGVVDMLISFAADGTPQRVLFSDAQMSFTGVLEWERYPSVFKFNSADEVFLFRPADFQFAPISFIELGGSQRYRGLFFPAPSHYEITRRAVVSFCVSLSRPSVEFEGAVETIYLERGIPLRSVETMNDRQISVTEFERGSPVIQYIDMDMDGRMETIRRFFPASSDFPENFNIRKLLASSESDWMGDGRYKTGEVYRQDGSVVYTWDMDGSGIMNYYYQTESGKE